MKKRVIALGYFDGVHLGHGALLRRTVELAEKMGASPAVLSFDTHPGRFLADLAPPQINSPQERKRLIFQHYGIEEVIFLHFDAHFMKLSWRQFLADLKAAFSPVHLVAGHDYRFGHKGEGTPDSLRAYCGANGLGCDIIPKVTLEGITISSTHIRRLLATGEMEAACRYLGHPHLLVDIVRSGYKLGRTMGAPTINMQFSEGVLSPKHGVYASIVTLPNGSRHPAVTNIGVRPTVGGERVSVESYILDYAGDLYGQGVAVEFFAFLRPEQKFQNLAALKVQIERDASETRAYFCKKSADCGI